MAKGWWGVVEDQGRGGRGRGMAGGDVGFKVDFGGLSLDGIR